MNLLKAITPQLNKIHMGELKDIVKQLIPKKDSDNSLDQIEQDEKVACVEKVGCVEQGGCCVEQGGRCVEGECCVEQGGRCFEPVGRGEQAGRVKQVKDLNKEQIDAFSALNDQLRDMLSVDIEYIYNMLATVDDEVKLIEVEVVVCHLDPDDQEEMNLMEFLYLIGGFKLMDSDRSLADMEQGFTDRQFMYYNAMKMFFKTISMDDFCRVEEKRLAVMQFYMPVDTVVGLTKRQIKQKLKDWVMDMQTQNSPYSKPIEFIVVDSKAKRSKSKSRNLMQSRASSRRVSTSRSRGKSITLMEQSYTASKCKVRGRPKTASTSTKRKQVMTHKGHEPEGQQIEDWDDRRDQIETLVSVYGARSDVSQHRTRSQTESIATQTSLEMKDVEDGRLKKGSTKVQSHRNLDRTRTTPDKSKHGHQRDTGTYKSASRHKDVGSGTADRSASGHRDRAEPDMGTDYEDDPFPIIRMLYDKNYTNNFNMSNMKTKSSQTIEICYNNTQRSVNNSTIQLWQKLSAGLPCRLKREKLGYKSVTSLSEGFPMPRSTQQELASFISSLSRYFKKPNETEVCMPNEASTYQIQVNEPDLV